MYLFTWHTLRIVYIVFHIKLYPLLPITCKHVSAVSVCAWEDTSHQVGYAGMLRKRYTVTLCILCGYTFPYYIVYTSTVAIAKLNIKKKINELYTMDLFNRKQTVYVYYIALYADVQYHVCIYFTHWPGICMPHPFMWWVVYDRLLITTLERCLSTYVRVLGILRETTSCLHREYDTPWPD